MKQPTKPNKNKDIITIGDEWTGEDRPSFICSYCNRTLIRLTDSSLQNTSFWCQNCSVEFDPESENVRRESKLSVPDRNQETLVATTPGQDYTSVQIHKEPKIKGASKVLQEEGIKITNYKEESPE